MSWDSIRRGSRVLERAAFVAAATAYLLPFVDPHLPLVRPAIGLELFFLTFPALAQGPWPWAFVVFFAFGLPLIVAVAGFAFPRRDDRKGALAGLVLAALGSAGLATAYVGTSTPKGWGYLIGPGLIGLGLYVGEAAFLLTALTTVVRLVAAWKLGASDEPMRDEPAMSASQWLLGRSRGDH